MVTCVPDELLGAGVDLVPGVGLVSVAGDDQPDLGGPGPVLGQLDELLVVARHQSAHGGLVAAISEITPSLQPHCHLASGCLTMTMLVVAAQAAGRSSGAGAGHSEGAKVCSTWRRAETCSWLMLAGTRGHDIVMRLR